ncbi:MAG: hypothetical protein JO162_06245, partial [Alphaproteobacteria bacterium]|nr:hypothetical protein [Alphaproteobacteria bacterium]
MALNLVDGAGHALIGDAPDLAQFCEHGLRIHPVLQDLVQHHDELLAEGIGNAADAPDQDAALGLRHQRRRGQRAAEGFLGAGRRRYDSEREKKHDNKPFHRINRREIHCRILRRSCLTIPSRIAEGESD